MVRNRKLDSKELVYKYEKVSIIVPTFNEKDLILRKISNLKSLTYKNFEVIFSDVSSDETPEIISRNIKDFPNFILLKSAKRGRSYQINQSLPLAKGEIILLTDVDGITEVDILEKMLQEFNDVKVAVVGAYVRPKTSYKIDTLFWEVQNRMRLLESSYGHSPVAIGVCFAFRRDLLDKIPLDVTADDIYIPFLANLKGFKTKYCPEIAVDEIRAPYNFKDFIKHKVRKAQDNIKELLRFLPKIYLMKPDWFIVYITRFMQNIISPIILPIFLTVFFFQKNFILLLISIAIVIISGVWQLYIFRTISFMISFIDTLKVFTITNFILLCAIFKYLFKRNISYVRIGSIVRKHFFIF